MSRLFRKLITYSALILLTVLLYTSCDSSTEPEEFELNSLPPITIEWNNNSSIVCFGTSLTFGDFATGLFGGKEARPNSDSTYPALLNKELKIKVYNEGYWGATAEEAINDYYPSVLDKNPSLIILEFGANEFLQDYDVQTAKTNIDSLIKMIIADDIKVVMLSFVNPDMLNSLPDNHPFASKVDLGLEYYEMLLDLAEENNILIDDYLYRDIFGKPELLYFDGVHPNNKGNVQLKNNVMESFYNTFEENNMLN